MSGTRVSSTSSSMPVPPDSPIAGTFPVTRDYYNFFLRLWQRTGGSTGNDASQQVEVLAQEVANLQVQIATLDDPAPTSNFDPLLALAFADVSSPTSSGGGSSTPSGPAGGDLGANYPAPVVTGTNGIPLPTSAILLATNSGASVVPASLAFGGDAAGSSWPDPVITGINGAAVPHSLAVLGSGFKRTFGKWHGCFIRPEWQSSRPDSDSRERVQFAGECFVRRDRQF